MTTAQPRSREIVREIRTDDAEEQAIRAEAADTATVPRPARLLTLAEWEALASQEPEGWLVEGLLAAGANSMLVGAPMAGKSTFAAGLTAHIATGTRFANRHVELGAVAWIYCDRPQLAHPAKLVRRALTGLGEEAAPIYLWSESPTFDMRDTAAVDALAEQLEAAGVVLVILDSLRRSTSQWEENSADDARTISDGLNRLSSGGKRAVLVVHHSPHDKDRPRGSSDLAAGIESTLHLTPKGEQVLVKAKHHVVAPESIALRVLHDDDTLKFGEGTSRPDDLDEAGADIRACMLRALRSDGPAKNVYDLRKLTREHGGKGKNERFDETRRELESEGLIRLGMNGYEATDG